MSPLSRLFASAFSTLIFTASAFAGVTAGIVTYAPTTKIISGALPFTPAAVPDPNFPINPYTVSITAPAGITYPQTVAVTVNIATIGNIAGGIKILPLGVTDAVAKGYVIATPSTLTFNAAGQTLDTVIKVQIDPTQAQTAGLGDYGYVINATGWVGNVITTDALGGPLGTTINLTVLPAPPTPIPPTITAVLPADGATFVYDPAVGTPISFPISFNADVINGVPSDAITSLTATIDGRAFDGSSTFSNVGSALLQILAPLQSTGLGDIHARGVVQSPNITDGGPHIIVVSAYNNGTPGDTKTTTINVLTPPKITSANATLFTIGQAGTFTVTATGFAAPTLSLTGGTLPAGLTFNSSTGVLSGTPTTGVGPRTLTFTATNSVRAVTQTFTLTVNPAARKVTANAASKTYGTSDPLPLTYTLDAPLFGTDTLTGSLSRVAGENVGSYAINQGTLAANSNYVLSYAGALFTINKAPQVISFGALAAKSVGAAPFALTAMGGGSGNAITYTSGNPAVATVSGNTVTILAAGTTVITANQAGNGNYNAANPVGQTLTVSGKLDQSITFGALGTKQVGTAPFALTATASSSLAVTYTSSNPSVATVSGSTVTVIAVGTTTITANQIGNATYNAALAVKQTLTVTGKANQSITFGALPAKQVGDAAFTLTATASSGLAVSYTSSNTAVATVSGNVVTIKAVGSTVITASQAGNATYNPATSVTQTLTVNAQTCPTTIMWLPPISLSQTQSDNCVIPIKFYLQQCCNSSTSSHSSDDDDDDDHYSSDDDDDDDHHNGCDDDGYYDSRHTGHSGDYSGSRVSCRHGSNGRSTNYSSCRSDCDHDDDDDGCVNLRDKTVIISIYEKGSSAPATQYKYGTGSAYPPDYIIDGDYKYQLNFTTARGTHTYHIDIYRYPPGSTTPKLVGTKEFSVR